MAIQIPKISINPESVGQAPQTLSALKQNDTSADDARFGSAIGQLGETVTAIISKNEQEYATTKGAAAGVQYHQQKEDLVNAAKGQEGDPTPVYNQLKAQTDSARQAILDQYKDASSDVQAQVAANLNDVDNKFYDRISAQRTVQMQTFDKNVMTGTITNAKQDLVSNSANVKVDDRNSLAGIDAQLDAIHGAIASNGRKYGLVAPVKDANGNVVKNDDGSITEQYSPSIRAKIAKEQSNAIYQAIDTLNSANKPELAQYVKDQYADKLLSQDLAKADKETKKTNIEVQGSQIAFSVRNLPLDQQKAALNKIKDPEVYDKALAQIETNKSKQNRLSELDSKSNYSQVATYIQSRNAGGKPFTDINDFQSDPMVKRLLPNVTDPKQVKALNDAILQPKDSDPKSLATAQSHLFNGDFANMKPEDFNQAMAGLSKTDRAKFTTKYMSINTPTGGQQNQMFKTMGHTLEAELNGLGVISKNKFGGGYNEANQKLFNDIGGEMVEASKTFPPGMSYPDQIAWVKKFAADKAAGKAFAPPVVNAPFAGSHQAPPPTTPPPKAPITVPTTDSVAKTGGVSPNVNNTLINGKTRVQWAQQFAKQYNKVPGLTPGPDGKSELAKYIEGQH